MNAETKGNKEEKKRRQIEREKKKFFSPNSDTSGVLMPSEVGTYDRVRGVDALGTWNLQQGRGCISLLIVDVDHPGGYTRY